jgi:hypothetical protein
VPFNLALRELVARANGRHNGRAPRSHRPPLRPALCISSPIALGHAKRDVAIAKELRAMVPNLRIDWLDQPTTPG